MIAIGYVWKFSLTFILIHVILHSYSGEGLIAHITIAILDVGNLYEDPGGIARSFLEKINEKRLQLEQKI